MTQNPSDEIKLGLPTGSLNHPERGPTGKFLSAADYDIVGYNMGEEDQNRVQIRNHPNISITLKRPQDFPRLLLEGRLDLAIVGSDWVTEQTINMGSDGIQMIGDLPYAKARIVIAGLENAGYDTLAEFFESLSGRDLEASPVQIDTEYPGIIERYVAQNAGYTELFGDAPPLVVGDTGERGSNRLVRILQTHGKTEIGPRVGADLIGEITQTGSALRANRLKEMDEIMKTSAGLYAAPDCPDWIVEEGRIMHALIQGAVIAEDYAYLAFNIPTVNVNVCTKYLVGKGLCAKAPDVSPDVKEDTSTLRILTPRGEFPHTYRTLKIEYGATDLVKLQPEWVER